MSALQRRRWQCLALGCTLLLALADTVQSAAEPGGIELTEEERRFLERNEPIVFVSQSRYPPFEFIDASAERRGIMVELAQWIATEAGFHAQLTDTVFQQAQERVLNGEADVLTSFFYSAVRDRQFDFTHTVFEVPAAIFVSVERPDIALATDLDGKRVATQRGDYAKEYLASLDIEVDLIQTDDFASAARAVMDGDADAMVGDDQIVLYYLYSSGLHESMKRVGEPLYVGLNAMAVVDGNHLLQSILNKGIEHARASGTLDRLQEKWIGAELPGPGFDWRDYWLYGAGLALVAILIVAWNVRLRQVVRRKTAELRRNEQRLYDILDATRTATWVIDLRSGELQVNHCWAEALGYRLEELQPITLERWRKMVHPADLGKTEAMLAQHLAGESEDYSCEFRMHHRLGHWVWLLDRGQVLERDDTGQALTMSGTRIDISAQKRAEEKLELAASVFQHAREGIVITDAKGDILEVNEAFTRITGYRRDEVLGRNPRFLQSGQQEKSFYQVLWEELLEKGAWEGELWNRRKNGETYPELLTISKVCDKQGRVSHFVAVFTDISRQKEHERQLQSMAFFDSLTELPNRILLADRLRQAMLAARRSGCKVSLAYLDLDGFKEINDRLGHAVGDRVLVTIAERLTSALREADTVARLGGDEFIIVLPEQSDVATVSGLIARLLRRIAEPIDIEGTQLYVSGSIGVVHFSPEDEIEPEQLIRQADQAMYQAKQAGKNRYHIFDTEHDRAVRGHYESVERMREALAHDEFVLHYQPKVNMSTGEVVGVEALIRWQHPERGLLAPASFLPAIQQHPLAIDLGEWVLAQALGQFEAWASVGIRLPVSVNIDAIHLQQADFVERLRAEIERHPSVRHGDLMLEVLETNALEDIVHVASVMKACRSFGVEFALDDFGTGYSSLTYLRHFPASMLKIDRSFVRDMLDDPEDLTILEGVLGLAVAFRRGIIAEGVETLLHGRMLLAMGYQLGQGYAIARPMPAKAIPAWLASWRPDPSWRHRQRARPEELQAIYAMVDHRACAVGLLCYLKGERVDPPAVSCRKSRLEQWLSALNESPVKGGEHASRIAALCTVYDRLAEEALELKEHEDDEQVKQCARRVEGVSEELLGLLQYWIDASEAVREDT
ncbi:EAL domain-containing protein [Halomonas sp. LR3S48]|uniref:EAL domain-containing protein n=1 Tax=Halomonas sp. LR3S48 TaxID=2982694 RepID=UPI0021E467C3|nr:EAL domain-containing protein [Halomonas sp. LR3S48]UYG05229.1 EAL domain-containing protein [Halomonas sp. LR3S48]